MRMRRTWIIASWAGTAAAASAQQFVNAGFERGTLAGWSVVNTANGLGAPGAVEEVDIDGPGPLEAGPAASFSVGQSVFVSGEQAGIEMTQMLHLTQGVEYTFAFDWSAQRTSPSSNSDGGRFALIVNGSELAFESAGTISGSVPRYGRVSATYIPATTGPHAVGVRITRAFLAGIPATADLRQYVDNFEPAAPVLSCYPNCDGSTNTPFLNVNDFVCFQAAFAAGSSYANCDLSTSEPVLNVNDFVCFQTAFAAGCSAP